MTLKIIQKPSPNFNERDDAKPSLIILHYTGIKSHKLAHITPLMKTEKFINMSQKKKGHGMQALGRGEI